MAWVRAPGGVATAGAARALSGLALRRVWPSILLVALVLTAIAMPVLGAGGRHKGASPAGGGGATPAAKAVPPSGKVLYERFCASCHGVSGKGDGVLAPLLTPPPTDLTALAKQNGGKLEEARLIAVIDGRRLVAAHGSREMPVWGAVFDEELTDQPFGRYTGLLRSQTLADYVRSIQQR